MRRRDFLACAGAAAAASVSTARGEPSPSAAAPLLIAGFRALYHLRFDEARAAFRRWQQDRGADPMGYAAEAASHLFEEFERHGVLTTEFFLDDDRLLGGIKGKADPARTAAFEKANDRARALAEGVVEKDPRNADALLALTLAAGLNADFSSLILKRQIDSLRQIRLAERYARRLIAVAPERGDGYMALGAASYIIACLPAYKRALLWVGGVQGDKRRGMDELERAASSGAYLAAYAKVMLALANVREKNIGRAQQLLRELTAEYPDSPLFSREFAKIQTMR